MDAFQMLDHCSACGVESAVAAVYDPLVPACLLGAAASSHCRLCARQTRGRLEPSIASPQDPARRLIRDRCPGCGATLSEEDRLGLRCARCGLRARDEEVVAGVRFGSVDQLARALTRWARSEGHDSVDEFVAASFLDGDLERVYGRIRAGEPVETNFDVLAFLFPETALVIPPAGDAADGGIAAASPARGTPLQPAAEAATMVESDEPEEAGEPEESPRRPGPAVVVPAREPLGADAVAEPVPTPPPGETGQAATVASAPPSIEKRTEAWAPLLPLVSVMVADGRVHPAEERFLQRVLARHQHPPIPAREVRVHRPEAVPTPPTAADRARMIEAMVHLMHVDRLRDGTELRVVEEYARAWGVDPADVARWDRTYRRRYTRGVRRLWMILESVLIAR